MEHVTLYDPDGQPCLVSSPRERVNLLAAGYRESKPFAPAEHTVGEVQAHLEQHPQDVSAVVAAESRTKARKGVLGGQE